MFVALCIEEDCNFSKKSEDWGTAWSLAWNHKVQETNGHSTFLAESENVLKEMVEGVDCWRLVPRSKLSEADRYKQIHREHPTEVRTICGLELPAMYRVEKPWRFKLLHFCRKCWNIEALASGQGLRTSRTFKGLR